MFWKFLEDFDLLKDPLVQELLKQKDYIDAITDNFRERGTIGCPAFLIGEKLEKCIKTILGIFTFGKNIKKLVETPFPAQTEPRFVLSDPKYG